MKEGILRINKHCEKSVLVIGMTGEGKSTLCSAFGGHKLTSKYDENLQEYVIEYLDPFNVGPKIGDQFLSTTKIPN